MDGIILKWAFVPRALSCCSECATAMAEVAIAELDGAPQAKKPKPKPKELSCGMNQNCAEVLLSGFGQIPQQAPPPPSGGTLAGKGIYASTLKRPKPTPSSGKEQA